MQKQWNDVIAPRWSHLYLDRRYLLFQKLDGSPVINSGDKLLHLSAAFCSVMSSPCQMNNVACGLLPNVVTTYFRTRCMTETERDIKNQAVTNF